MDTALATKLDHLIQICRSLESVLVAFSGGIDSSLVLKVAHQALDSKAVGVTAVSPTFSAIELDWTRRLAAEMGVRHLVQLESPAFVQNDASRCYHCKTDLYQVLGTMRQELGLHVVVDGTNLDDLREDRPGLVAARELGVRSPLVEAELTKSEVRTMAQALGLSNWDKPAAACLSSRIPRGIPITREKLSRVEQAEALLFREGFGQFRVRDHGDIARIELEEKDFPRIWDRTRREHLCARLKELGFRFVTLDVEGYRPGSTNGGSG
jgi:pyridinium-3,5-biscarboxylic acid mononucleotide sulfurtransferase